MKYRLDKYGNKISVLGFGCMRLTQKNGKIDIEKAVKEIMEAYNSGVNYYDTAYLYPGNESALGEVLERTGIRDKINIATKLPHYMIKSLDNINKCFNEELKRLRTDHIDYYLMHMLTDIKSWERLKALGIEDWIKEKKASGQIRQIGFSYHGNSDMFCELIDTYDWDFCMIQYNYLDEHSQAGRTGLNYAASKGIPTLIMEPLRGGRLVKQLPEKAKKLFANYKIKRSPAEWAFKWLWNQPEIMCVLSGMNSLDMVKENVKFASTSEVGEFTDDEYKLLEEVVNSINEKMKVGCTGCRYCMPCPQNVDIPGTFSAYNKCYSDSKYVGLKEYVMCTLMRKDATSASNCIECGKCEQHCPQGIEIRKELKKASKELEGPLYKLAKKNIKLFLKY
ncbi:MAG: aldo/keto reductase [Clostridia bacterium]|nr:aldo/keto reductase [Clostridia bacterium]